MEGKFRYRKMRSSAVAVACAGAASILLAPPPMASAAGPSLGVVKASLHQYDGGPPVSSNFEFISGDTVFLTFRIGGFQTTEKDDEETFRLSYNISAFDPQGVLLKERVNGLSADELAQQDKKEGWMPLVRYDVLIPPSAPSGDYRIVVAVDDQIGGGAAGAEMTFRVKGIDIEPSDSLVLRNFHFFATETATRPLSPPSYRPGDSVWARFDIIGYQFGENNRFDVDYGLKVLRASGKLLFEQPVAAAEQRESFYPQRHIGGGLSLNLTPDLALGDYTVIVIVRDKVGGQTYEEEQIFHVE